MQSVKVCWAINQKPHRVNMCSEIGSLYASAVAIGLPEHFRLLGHWWNANYIKRKWKSSRTIQGILLLLAGFHGCPKNDRNGFQLRANCSFLSACIQQPYDLLFIISSPTPAQLWHTSLIRSSLGASLPSQRTFPSSPSSRKLWLSPGGCWWESGDGATPVCSCFWACVDGWCHLTADVGWSVQ